MKQCLLSVQDLYVNFGAVRAIDGVSFDLAAGESLAIIGETGSGKTTLARALLGLHPAGSVQGSIRLNGNELIGLSERDWGQIRWKVIALAVQNAASSFDPVYRVGEQIIEPMRQHLSLSNGQSRARALALAEQVGLTERHLRAYPHQLSGGEKQRLMLAMALSCDPDLLILDEPTSGQDMLSRERMIDLLRRLRGERHFALLLISHDLAAAAALTDHTAVLYPGKVAETGDTRTIFTMPRHPYSWGLLNAYPNMTTSRDLSSIRGQMPDPTQPPSGCRFHPRCTQAVEDCRHREPQLEHHDGRQIACHLGGLQTLISAQKLHKSFSLNGSGPLPAVRDVSLDILHGEVVAVVGETGSGKTTLGKLLVGLLEPDMGDIAFDHAPHQIQMIPQDPFESVNPLFTVRAIVQEPLDIQRVGTRIERTGIVRETLAAVGLPTDDRFLQQQPQSLSGGQLQRVVIARALVLQPKLLVADEPVSMLDPSEAARLINLIKSIQNERGMGLLLISHDIALIRKVADRILVMRDGAIIEQGLSSVITSHPEHSYTRNLLAAAPAFDWFSHNGDR
jgi:peptide/nickel transport system ATP-binding protein